MADYFSIRDVSWVLSIDSVTIEVITDVPCHLYMRWTLVRPRIHSKSSIRRGLAQMKDVRFCFVIYHDNEQEEAGDTLIHTFVKPDWPVCEIRWFYFWGEVNAVVSPSTSPLFKLHNDYELPPSPPVPPEGDMWFFPYIHNPSSGTLYVAIDNAAKDFSTIYRSTDYANSWESVLNSDSFGGINHRPWMLAVTSIGFLCLVYHTHGAFGYWQVYSAPSLAGPWTVRLGGTAFDGIWRGYPYLHVLDNNPFVWCSGQIKAVGNRPMLHRSSDGGLTWCVCYTLVDNTHPSMIKVDNSTPNAIICSVGLPADWQCRRSQTPGLCPGTWDTLGIACRARRVAYVHPYVVLPYAGYYCYSSDGGVVFANKPIPAGMEVAGTNYYANGLDGSDLRTERIIVAPSGLGLGVWVSYNWGDNWVKTLADLGQPVDPYLNSVWWDRHDDTICYAFGRLGFWRSNDAGLTWTQRNNGLPSLP